MRSSRASGAARPRVAVVGAGPAGLMAAEVASAGADVTVYERMPSPARKLLLAGRGGLNLTHSEDEAAFRRRYGAAAPALGPALAAFGPPALRRWCADLGVDTFVGTSGRVFPASFKASPLLRAWLRRLAAGGVRLAPRHHWRGWDGDGALRFATPNGDTRVAADAVVLALGGASWPRLGADGTWVDALERAGVAVAPLRPANCGFALAWSELFRARHEGEPLKNVELAFAGQRSRGDLVITRAGLEGGPLYALAGPLRDALAAEGHAVPRLALRPDLGTAALAARLARRRAKQSLSTHLRKHLNLPPVAVSLLHESENWDAPSPRLAALDAEALAHRLNTVPLRLAAAMPLDRAISTAGGVSWDGLDERFMLHRRPSTFLAGEMLDWEAPTGGYLLQACFATGAAAGRGVLAWLNGRSEAGDADGAA